jgi:hypothetical protein
MTDQELQQAMDAAGLRYGTPEEELEARLGIIVEQMIERVGPEMTRECLRDLCARFRDGTESLH